MSLLEQLLGLAIQIATLAAILLNLRRVRELHVTMNSRLDRLLASEGELRRAEGRAEGRAEQQLEDRNKSLGAEG